MLSSKHSLLLTCDADMSTPIEEIEKLIPYVTKEFISKKAAPSPLSLPTGQAGSPSRGEDGSKSAPPLRGGDEGEGDFDIAIGSRALRESDIVIRQPWYRERMGKTFNLFVRALVMGGISDTQCGFKLFKGEVARDLFAKSLIRGFSFDVEILFLARKAGYGIMEVPVKWFNSENSKIRILKDSSMMFLELLKIRAAWLRGRYTGLKRISM